LRIFLRIYLYKEIIYGGSFNKKRAKLTKEKTFGEFGLFVYIQKLNIRKKGTMKLSKKFAGGIVFIVFLFALASAEATQKADEYIPFSSMLMKGGVDVKIDSQIREKAQISLHFTLGADSNGIFPKQENVEIGFSTASIVGVEKQCFVIFIPANSFENVNNWYEIHEPEDPAGIGIKILVVSEATGELIKDLTDSLRFFVAALVPVVESQYYFTIEARFEHENTDLMSMGFIGSSIESVLILGDDRGSSFAQNIEFKHPFNTQH
jgi:hypothetical protein